MRSAVGPERWPEVRRALEAVLDGPAEQRPALLDLHCGGDEPLRRAVVGLLDREVDSRELLAPPLEGAAFGLLGMSAAVEEVGRCIGPYRLVEVIAVGGMGAVYRAVRQDGHFEQEAAIKLVRRGMATPELLRRFERERQLLAGLEHPHITRLLDGGATQDGLPYFVMELVRGEPIDRYCRRRALSIRERLELFRQVCAAVHHAHQHLVVHRDLKPGNILVVETKGGADVGPDPAAPAVRAFPKIIDFGIAGLLDGPEPRAGAATLAPALTPQYASPEQIRGERLTTAADVYSLGVVLYELLTDRPPFADRGAPRYELERRICESEPRRPSESARALADQATAPDLSAARVRRELDGDLDNIVLKAMRKEPSLRYRSTLALSDDLAAYLHGDAVSAHPPSAIYRLRKLARRNRWAFALGAAAFGLLATLAATSTVLARSARSAERRERAAHEAAARMNVLLTDLLGAASPSRQGGDATVLESLGQASRRLSRELADEPALAARAHLTIGSTYYRLGRHGDAEQAFRAALRTARRCEEADAALESQCLGHLSATLAYANQPEAIEAAREALDITRRLLGQETPEAASGLHTLGFAIMRCSKPPRYDEAERLYAESLALTQTLFGRESLRAARIQHAMAACSYHRGRLEEAAARYRDSLELLRRAGSGGELALFECLGDYARCLTDQGLFADAEEVSRETIDLSGRVLGTTWRAGPLTRAAALAMAQGRLDASAERLSEAIRMLSIRVALREPATATALNGLLTASSSAAVDQNALSRLLEQVGEKAVSAEPESGTYLELLTVLGEYRATIGDAPGAEVLLREALRIAAPDEQAESLWAARVERALGTVLLDAGRPNEAEPLLQHSVDVSRAWRGEGSVQTRRSVEALTELWRRTGRRPGTADGLDPFPGVHRRTVKPTVSEPSHITPR